MCHYRDNSDNTGPGLPLGLFLGQVIILNTEIIGEDFREFMNSKIREDSILTFCY